MNMINLILAVYLGIATTLVAMDGFLLYCNRGYNSKHMIKEFVVFTLIAYTVIPGFLLIGVRL